MPAPTTVNEFVELIIKSGVVEQPRVSAYMQQHQAGAEATTDLQRLAGLLVRDGILTVFQAEQFLQGKWKRFNIGKYRVLERLGSGGMGQVFLCEHKLMRRRVAVKVLPTAKAEDASSLERFYREARAVAALDHPNIARAYDIDNDDNLHFLVMEYVDGASFQDIVKKNGVLDVVRACHYIFQASLGLQHAHEAGLVHRDIKPGNVLVDRGGLVKVLDMGLARFFNDEEDILTKKYDESVLGTADYLAPEQAIDSHSVDIRADVYSLGATFYYLLTGSPPFSEGTIAQKLIWHQTKQPKPIRQLRPEVPEALITVINQMMAKNLQQRFQTPIEVAEALRPWTQTPIGPPPLAEMPTLCLAAAGTSVQARASAAKTSSTNLYLTAAALSSSVMQGKPPSSHAGSAEAFARGMAAPPATPLPNGPSSMVPVMTATATATAQVAAPDDAATWAGVSDGAPLASTVGPRTSTRRPAVATAPTRKRLYWIGGGIAAGVLLIGLLAFFLSGPSGKPKTGPQVQPDDGKGASKKLIVGVGGEVASLREALAKAKDGEQIILKDDVHVEPQPLALSKISRGVTVSAAGSKPATIKFKDVSASGPLALISIDTVEGLTLKNLIVQADNQHDNVVRIVGRCPNLRLEQVELHGVKRYGVLFSSCSGEATKPIVLEQVSITTASNEKESAALRWLATPTVGEGATTHVQIKRCRLEGPWFAGLSIQGSVKSAEVSQTRFFRMTYGIHAVRPLGGQGFDGLTLSDNTFHSISERGVLFGGVPAPPADKPALSNFITIERNAFAEVKQLAQVDDSLKESLRCIDNVRDEKTTQEGNFKLKAAAVPTKLNTDPKNPDFLLAPKEGFAGGRKAGVPTP
jgi:serine/threonine protein kinase